MTRIGEQEQCHDTIRFELEDVVSVGEGTPSLDTLGGATPDEIALRFDKKIGCTKIGMELDEELAVAIALAWAWAMAITI